MSNHVSTFAFLKTFLTDRGHPNIWREPPANIDYALPIHVITRFGGGNENVVVDLPRVDTFAADIDSAEAIAEQIRTLMLTALVGYASTGATVLRVRVMTGPRQLPWLSSNVYRIGATYELRVHRTAGIAV
jgi:hypothetical protein